MLPNILLLLALLFLTPKVFFNTNQNYPTFSIQQPTPTPMDVFKQTCQPQDNPLSIPMSLMHHHHSQDTMQSSVHFSYLHHMDQLKEKQEKFYAARHQRIQQQKGKLSTCSELPKCCERYTFLCENCVFMVPFTVVGFMLYFFLILHNFFVPPGAVLVTESQFLTSNKCATSTSIMTQGHNARTSS